MRVEPALAPVGVFQAVEFDLALPDAHGAQAANASRIAKQLALNAEAFLAVVVNDEPRPAFTERGVDIFIPKRERLQNVAVGVDSIIGPCHCLFLPGLWIPRHGSAGPTGRRVRTICPGCVRAVAICGLGTTPAGAAAALACCA